MKKITFKNLPDKTAPISANNLNQLQNNVEEAILNPVVESIECKNKFDMNGNILESIGYTSGTNTLESGKIKSTANIANGNGKGQIIQLKPNTVYTYSVKISGYEVSGSTCLRISPVNSEGNAVGYLVDQTVICEVGKVYSYSFTTSDTGKIWVMLNGISNSDDYSILKYIVYEYIQIEEGSTATSYTSFKRYGYNNKESMGSIVVDDIRSKNFFDVNKITSTTVNGVTISKNANGGLVLNGTATGKIEFFYVELVSESKIKPGKTYTLSSNALSQDNKLQVFLQNSNSATWVSTIANIKGTINPNTFTVSTLPGTHFKFLILILEGATLNNFVLYPQIEEGSTATNYSEYKGIGYTSGQNANGSWVKYDDGRMECWGVKSYNNVEVNVLDITEYYAQLPAQPFPQAFISSPICVMSIDNVQPGYALQLKSTGNGATETHTPMTLAFCAASITATRIDVHYHAIGRWK